MADFNLPDLNTPPNIRSVFQNHIADLKTRYERWVANVVALPLTGDYKGQRIGVTAENRHYFWDGNAWVPEQTTWSTITGKPNSFTPSPHTHNADDITAGTLAEARIPNLNASKIASGTLPIARGGTGATTADTARDNLGIYVQNTRPTGVPVGTLRFW